MLHSVEVVLIRQNLVLFMVWKIVTSDQVLKRKLLIWPSAGGLPQAGLESCCCHVKRLPPMVVCKLFASC